MQTYMGLVRNPADATLIFEACRQGKLPRIQRRLSDRERNAIRSGSIFVWDEKEAGMRRWTDGKSWSASRVAGSFLTYREMEGKRVVGDISAHPRGPGHSGEDSDDAHEGDAQKYEMTESYKYKVDGLIKQSFSITTSEDQKLHLISYYGRSHPNNAHLRPPTQDPALMHIQIPRGLYPESTLELAIPLAQPNARPDDHRYGPVSASLVPAPNAFHHHQQQQPQQPSHQQVQQLMPPYAQQTSFQQDGAWDHRNGSQARPREIRPTPQMYDQARELQEHHMKQNYPPPPLQQLSQPLQHQQHQQQHHHQQPPPSVVSNAHTHAQVQSQQQHAPVHHHTQAMQQTISTPRPTQQQVPLQGPHPYPQSIQNSTHIPQVASAQPYGHSPQTPIDKSNGHNYTQAHARSGSSVQPYGQQTFSGGRSESSRPPLANNATLDYMHTPTNLRSQDLENRRISDPRAYESPRRSSIPHFGAAQATDGPVKLSIQDDNAAAAAAAAGQQISIPDLGSAMRLDIAERPIARDIPTDRLGGRWQEETRALDALRDAMKL